MSGSRTSEVACGFACCAVVLELVPFLERKREMMLEIENP
jgi:hypothetical protein